MPIILPTSPEPIAPFTPRIVRLRNDVTSLVGGNRQRRGRKGDHYAGVFNMPPMVPDDASAWRGVLSAGDTVLMNWPQPGLAVGSPGAPRVDGAVQLGSNLKLKGLTPGYVFRKGQFLSIVTAGRRWLYGADAEAVANSAGIITIPLEVMIRTFHNDNDVVEIVQPKIEGLADYDEDVWQIDDDGYVWTSFTIEERG